MLSPNRYFGLALVTFAAACSGVGSDARSGSTPSAGPGPSGGVVPGDAGKNADASADSAPPGAPPPPDTSAPNVLRVTVNGPLCLDAKYTNINEPCTSVTICQPGTKSCQTIDGILVDTGSTGLRLFKSAVHLALPAVPSGAGTLAECESFSGGMSSWGPLATADVVLGSEPPVTTPVLLIDSAFSRPTGPCDPSQSTLDTTPEGSGFNGILGISHHADDCGDACRASATNDTYFRCTATSCVGTATDVQLVNPIGLLPIDGNGYFLELPGVAAAGAPSVTGSLILGIGTRANNAPGSVKVFPTAGFGTLFPDFDSTPIQSGTIDSGSSKLYFPAIAGLPVCNPDDAGGAPQTGLLCPPTPRTLSATMISGGTSNTLSFTVDNADALLASNNSVFPGYASAVSTRDPYFMWGLPFFLGRAIYVAIDDKPTPLGKGPYWAY